VIHDFASFETVLEPTGISPKNLSESTISEKHDGGQRWTLIHSEELFRHRLPFDRISLTR
jgi:hypothetical protein